MISDFLADEFDFVVTLLRLSDMIYRNNDVLNSDWPVDSWW